MNNFHNIPYKILERCNHTCRLFVGSPSIFLCSKVVGKSVTVPNTQRNILTDVESLLV